MVIKIYTDGSCLKNPGPGGWSVIISNADGVTKKTGFKSRTTNNEMELTAVLEALREIDIISGGGLVKIDFVIYSDSAYVVNAINNEWLTKWKMNHWRTSKEEEVKNKKLWMSVYLKLGLLKRNLDIKFSKVKGHSGNAMNELADKMARESARNAMKGKDEDYDE
jgi:ribonuclease HI